MARFMLLAVMLCLFVLRAVSASADAFFFSTGNPDGKMATASRPGDGTSEIESADDFVLTAQTTIKQATFTGLLTGDATTADIGQVVVEIYRVFPHDSDATRTPNVPTRTNSPSDVALDSRDAAAGSLSFSASTLGSFTATNSVQPGGIKLNTGGGGPITGQEVQFTVTFITPLSLPADHYFFVPQVEVTGGEFYWLSAPRPIVDPGTPFPQGFADLQSWTRDAALDPDWLRVGTDIVGIVNGSPAPTFNATFFLSGETVPLPASAILLGSGLLGLGALRRFRKG